MRKLFLCTGLGGLAIFAAFGSLQAQTAGDSPLACLRTFKCEYHGACELPCLPSGAVPDQASSADEPAVTPAEAPAQGDAKPPAHQSAPRVTKMVRKVAKAPLPLTIAAGDVEVAPLRVLANALPDQPVTIVRTALRQGTASKTDLSVSTSVGPIARDRPGQEAKLFTEQLHVIAGGQTKTIDQLADRVVSFGPNGSASQEAAQRAFKALGIAVKETPLDLANALDGVATGDIDAVVVLAPRPLAPLQAIANPTLHLLPWPDQAKLPAGMVLSQIGAADYPGLIATGTTLRTVGVEAVLTARRDGTRHASAERLFAALAQHSTALSHKGFDLLKADRDAHTGRVMASYEKR